MTPVMATRERAPRVPTGVSGALASRVAALDWAGIAEELQAHGCATTGVLLAPAQCSALAESYASDSLFRSRIVMARHGFGRGEYKYFAYPLPETIALLRSALYPPLSAIANAWNEAMGSSHAIPAITRSISIAATGSGSNGRPRFSCDTGPATTTACTRTSTEISSSPCRWHFSCRGRARISPAANSCSRNSAPACSRAPRWCRWRKAKV